MPKSLLAIGLIALFLLSPACATADIPTLVPIPTSGIPATPAPTPLSTPAVVQPNLAPPPVASMPSQPQRSQVVTTIMWAPGERKAYFELVQESFTMVYETKLNAPPPTRTEYRTACEALQKHGFDITSVAMDPATTDSVAALAGGLDGTFKVWARMEWESRMGLYTLPHFCEDATGS